MRLRTARSSIGIGFICLWGLGENGNGRGVASCLLFSRYLIKHGELNGDDIDNFPEPLKSRLLMSQYISWILLVSLFMEAIAVKVLRWHVQL